MNFEVDFGVDRASGIEVCNTMLITRAGAAWALPAADKKDAEQTAVAMKGFLGLLGYFFSIEMPPRPRLIWTPSGCFLSDRVDSPALQR